MTETNAKYLRLNKFEQEAIRIKAVEINKKLLDLGMQPLNDSALLHEILKIAIKSLKINNKGILYIEE